MLRPGLAVLLLLLAAAAGAAPRVVATVPPAAAVAAAVTDGAASLRLLLPGGQSPHGAALRPSAARALAEADLVVWVGPTLESGLARAVAALPAQRVLTWTALAGVRLRGGEAGPQGVDPHLWLDPANAAVLAQALAERLAALDPAAAERYRARAARFAADLAALEGAMARRLAPLRGRGLVVYHDALGYLTARFGLRVVATVAPDPERLPGARHVGELRARIARGEVACVVREPQFPPRLLARLVAGTRVPVVAVDVVGAGLRPGPEAYRRLLEGVVAGLEGCLGG
ncbi:metal ABC transporter solute-binding protein, Zn/Mn family [Inmirania thermothiophila]|uniref:High-affinity zinc uptake system protein ZnuA n=1 Tax=Inmirania thermothiophila TaxID=1750597 RepID=A0A3N1Y3X8_9GAMM|nr:zinc ABC transporter substrate-binding protein [Inmirania thermothiophila]ROR31987.1 zinc transport system substrate-binding protein [Inmirania thermothiophila]